MHTDMMMWWYDAMIIWWYGDMMLWWYDPMMMWWYDAFPCRVPCRPSFRVVACRAGDVFLVGRDVPGRVGVLSVTCLLVSDAFFRVCRIRAVTGASLRTAKFEQQKTFGRRFRHRKRRFRPGKPAPRFSIGKHLWIPKQPSQVEPRLGLCLPSGLLGINISSC